MNDAVLCQGCGAVPEAGHAFPLCATCRTLLANRPFPRWIYIAGLAVLIILAVAISQSPRTLRAGVAFERGQSQETAGAYETAVSEYRKVAEAFPDSTLVLARLAVSLKKAGHVPEAEVILQRLGGRKAPKELVQEVNQTVDQLENERKALSVEIDQKKAAVAALEARIRELDQRISAAEEQLRALKPQIAAMEEQAKNGVAVDEQEYHRLVSRYNAIVDRHNADLTARKDLYAQYETQLEEVNKLVAQYNRLAKPKVGTP